MAMASSKVFEFLEDLSTSVSELAAKELETLKDLKIKEDANSPFGIEELLYYVKKYEEEKSSVDFVALKEYFPVSLVLQGIFKIVQDLFCLRFEEIMGGEVWHDDVRVFSVFDFSSGELMGYVYLDLYSREEKYSQTCVLPLQNGSLSSNGARQVSIVLLMTEHQKKDIDSVAVLRFSEVVSLFHEFGHVVHHICNHSSLARSSGLHVDHDFLEIPGHMFENCVPTLQHDDIVLHLTVTADELICLFVIISIQLSWVCMMFSDKSDNARKSRIDADVFFS